MNSPDLNPIVVKELWNTVSEVTPRDIGFLESQLSRYSGIEKAEFYLLKAGLALQELNYEEAEQCCERVESLGVSLEMHLRAQFQLGEIAMFRGNYNSALNYFFYAYSQKLSLNFRDAILAKCNYGIASVSRFLGDYSNSLKYSSSGISHAVACGDLRSEVLCFQNNAICKMRMGEDQKSMDSVLAAFFKLPPNTDKFIECTLLKTKADIFLRFNKKKEALEIYNDVINITEKSNQVIICSMSMLRKAECLKGTSPNDEKYAELILQAYECAKNGDFKSGQKMACNALYEHYNQAGNVEKAFKFLQEYHNLDQEIQSKGSSDELVRKDSQLLLDSHENELKLLKEIEEKHHEISDSINYAKRIQDTILPLEEVITESIPNHFVLFKPKDVVSGDFYWFSNQFPEVIIAAADCTGHGVPGAIVSVVCSQALKRAVVEDGMKDPGQILNRCREVIIDQFDNGLEDIKDGMDISLAVLNMEKGSLKWAGANNPLWLLRNGSEEIEIIKPDKQPVGKYAVNNAFTTQSIELKTGDIFYLFSDGYADQFGGPNGKKFKYSRLRELLIDINLLPMDEQKVALENQFESWKGELEQIDDICLFVVKM